MFPSATFRSGRTPSRAQPLQNQSHFSHLESNAEFSARWGGVASRAEFLHRQLDV